ncbi:unnamed protein product [Soboliphyme baturini]|uniref:DUF295 domain-containing protein n=1 Tax=Soboliphyme baturini TaxID=241478 RepID=A0A183JAW3_9BILA|nr:unnamed protein product [Soboliphyme baturini]
MRSNCASRQLVPRLDCFYVVEPLDPEPPAHSALLVKILKKNIEAFRVGSECFEEPCNAFMLPEGNIVVVDTINGLFLFSSHTELLKMVRSDEWKWPQGLTYHATAHRLLVSLLRRNSASKWQRAIGIFDEKLEFVSFMDGPEDDDECLVYDPKADCLLFCVSDNLGSAFYRRSMTGNKWHMVYHRQGVTYVSMQVLMCSDMVSEVLVIEGRSSYLYKLALTDGRAANRKLYIPAERPTAICLDEERQLFVFDAIVGKIMTISSVTFEKRQEVSLSLFFLMMSRMRLCRMNFTGNNLSIISKHNAILSKINSQRIYSKLII